MQPQLLNQQTWNVWDDVGAHTKGFNKDSLGYCLMGGISKDGLFGFTYSTKQMEKLWDAWEEVRKALS